MPNVGLSTVPALRMVAAVLALMAMQREAAADPQDVRLLDSPGGQIAIVGSQEQSFYDNQKYAPARRAGDYIYLSGSIVARDPNAPPSPDAFKEKTREVFRKLQARLRALGADMADVVMINSFHDWSAPEFNGDRRAQLVAFNSVKEEFMGASPHPAWTAVGTSGLFLEQGIAEVQMIAYAPVKRAHVSSKKP